MPKFNNQRFITVTNKTENSKIRTITDDAGDEIIIVPSYTHPADIVMNGILYPEDENRKAANAFSGVPVPYGHPTDADGNFISASSEIGVNRYQFGAFNGEASYDEKSKRIYAEVRINKRKAEQEEYGRKVLAAIEAGEPISTSTGLFVDVEEAEGESNGQQYTMIASNYIPDHNAILLEEEPAANVETGTGMMINGKRVEYAGNLDDSMRELESRLYDAVREEFSDPKEMLHAWVADWNHDELVYEVGGDSYLIKWQETDDGEIQFVGEAQPVKRRTLWEAVKNLFARTGKTSYNQSQRGRGGRVIDTLNRGDDMSLRQKLIDKLKANKVELDYDKVTDEQLLEAVEAQTATNQAENEPEPSEPTEQTGEVSANEAVVAAINSALKPLTDKVDALEAKLNAEKETELAEMRKKLNEEGDYEEGEVDDMGEKAVRAAYKRLKGNSEQAPAWHFAPNTEFKGNADEFSTEMPE